MASPCWNRRSRAAASTARLDGKWWKTPPAPGVRPAAVSMSMTVVALKPALGEQAEGGVEDAFASCHRRHCLRIHFSEEVHMPKGRVRRSAPMVGLAARAAVGRVGAALRRRLGNDEAVVGSTNATPSLRRGPRRGQGRADEGGPGGLVRRPHRRGRHASTGASTARRWRRSAPTSSPWSPELARAVVEAELGAPPEELFALVRRPGLRGGVDRPGPPGRAAGTVGRWRSRCSTPAPPTPSPPTWPTPSCSAPSSGWPRA